MLKSIVVTLANIKQNWKVKGNTSISIILKKFITLGLKT